MLPEDRKRIRRLYFLAFLSVFPLLLLARVQISIFMDEFLFTLSLLGLSLFLIEGVKTLYNLMFRIEFDRKIYNSIQHLYDMEDDE